jgi:hypothetical protein
VSGRRRAQGGALYSLVEALACDISERGVGGARGRGVGHGCAGGGAEARSKPSRHARGSDIEGANKLRGRSGQRASAWEETGAAAIPAGPLAAATRLRAGLASQLRTTASSCSSHHLACLYVNAAPSGRAGKRRGLGQGALVEMAARSARAMRGAASSESASSSQLAAAGARTSEHGPGRVSSGVVAVALRRASITSHLPAKRSREPCSTGRAADWK